jgi:poly(A) polymerase
MDDLEARIADLAEREELASIRPAIDGHRVMELLGVAPGRVVGDALDMLLEARIEEGPMTEEEAEQRLLAWAASRGLGGTPPTTAARAAKDSENPTQGGDQTR